MNIKEMVASEYKERLSNLKEDLNKAEKKRVEVLTKLAFEIQEKEAVVKKLSDKQKELEGQVAYVVEKKFKGIHVVLHKKGKEVRLYSKDKKDLTATFPALIEETKKLSDNDFIVDGCLVPYKERKVLEADKADDFNTKLHIWDITHFDKPLTNLILRERLDILNRLKFTDRITCTERKIIRNAEEAEKAIKWAGDSSDSFGAVVKRLNAPYAYGESERDWIKYSKLTKVRVKKAEVKKVVERR